MMTCYAETNEESGHVILNLGHVTIALSSDQLEELYRNGLKGALIEVGCEDEEIIDIPDEIEVTAWQSDMLEKAIIAGVDATIAGPINSALKERMVWKLKEHIYPVVGHDNAIREAYNRDYAKVMEAVGRNLADFPTLKNHSGEAVVDLLCFMLREKSDLKIPYAKPVVNSRNDLREQGFNEALDTVIVMNSHLHVTSSHDMHPKEPDDGGIYLE
jgi:hypothetical protein